MIHVLVDVLAVVGFVVGSSLIVTIGGSLIVFLLVDVPFGILERRDRAHDYGARVTQYAKHVENERIAAIQDVIAIRRAAEREMRSIAREDGGADRYIGS